MPQPEVDTKVARAIHALRILEDQKSEEVVELLNALLEDIDSMRSDTGASIWGVRGPGDDVVRTSHGVSVFSKELVMKVFLDSDENYSVWGYADRARHCFGGEIYLALDKGPQYDRQSTRVNAAIGSISAADAFYLALRETRVALAANPAIVIAEISNKVQAALCRIWFDLPDGIDVVDGGLRLDTQPPARCPGDFMTPSGYIFKPDPGFLTVIGPAHGQLLKQGVAQFVAELQKGCPSGALSGAIFEAFPRGEDDLVARTLIGVMMGMLPTVHYNLTRIVDAWRLGSTPTFDLLKEALRQHGGTDAYARAKQVLIKPLMLQMQFDPEPSAVWRTAVKEHSLGSSRPVQVHPGDKIFIGIASATREDLNAGIADVFPVFGGDRSGTPHPTHACPGYEMAMGILLGIINGVMEPT